MDPALYDDLWQTIVRGDTWHGEMINRKKNGELYWERATISPIKDSSGQTTHYLAVKEDISLRKQINQSTKLHNQHLALINHAGRIFNSTLELDKVIQIMLSEMHQLMNIEATSYWLVVPETGELVCQQATGPGRETVVGWRLSPGMGLTGQAAKNNQVLVVADCYQDERHYSAVDEQTGIKLHSMLLIPMHIKGEVIGVLNLSDTQVNRFTEHDVALLEPVAAVATSAIKNAQLFKESQHQHKIAESLRSVAAVLGSSLDFDTVLQKIFEQLAQVIGYDGAGLFLEENNILTLVEAAGIGQSFIGHSVPLNSDNFTVLPFLRREPVVVANVQNDPRWRKDWPDYDFSKNRVKNWMGVPMLRDNTPLGVLTVDSFDANAYTLQDAHTLQMFAGQASIALQNARYVEQTQQALHQTQILYRVSSTLAKSTEFTTGVTDALAELLRALNLQQGGITLFSEDKKSGRLLVLFKEGRLKPIEKPLTIVSKIYEHVIATQQPQIVVDALTHPLLADNRDLTLTHNIKSILLVPLLVRSEVIGVIGADSTTEQRNFNNREIGLAQSIADQVATALENANLLEQEQRQRRMAESLRQVVLVINSSLNQETVISKILEQLRQVIRFDSAGLFLLEDDLLRLNDGANIKQDLLGYAIRVQSNNRTATVFKQKTPIITPDVREDPYWEVPSSSGPILGWMAAPLLVGDEAIGVLTLDSYTPDVYTLEDAQTLQLFANHAAMAIQNARLYRETQQTLAQLQATQSQLIIQEKMASLGLLTAGIAHEIKNPLNFVTSFAQLTVELTQDLRRLLADRLQYAETPAEVNQILDDLQFNANSITEEGFRANNIVDSMLLHSRGGSQQPQPTNINSLLDEAVTLTNHSLKAKDPEYRFVINTNYDDTLPALVVNPQDISRVFVNLINNAYAATLQKFNQQPDSFTGLLYITTASLDTSVEIRIKDNGVGLTPEVQENLFAPFFTTKPTGEGTGLGLSITYDIIVQKHSGTIDVNSVPGEFTEFVIRLPISSSDWS
jgi:GAF domain-containing protein